MEKNELLFVPTLNDEVIWETNDVDEYHWIENHTFNGWLTLDSQLILDNPYQVKYAFTSHDGTKRYEIFAEDLFDIMKHMYDGKIAGVFEFVRRKNRYGIKLIHPSTK